MNDDLISLEDAIEAIADVDITDGTEPVFSGKQVIGLLKDLDAITPQEPKTGHWIEKDGFDGDVYYDCSECGESWTTIEGTPWDNEWNYCPNCGARMVEPQESEE